MSYSAVVLWRHFSPFLPPMIRALFILSLWAVGHGAHAAELPTAPAGWFGIHVLDEQTGRGVPLVELRTVNDIRMVTDNAGWIAWQEPGLMDREVFFHVSGPGIQVPKDGFGYACFRPLTRAGTTVELKVKRITLAERVGRVTGQGMYRDSALLGFPHPVPNLLAPGVMGQDSVQMVKYNQQLFWLWGDTNVPHYQLGNYQTTSALTPLEAHPERGLRYEYFTQPQHPEQLRHMLPLAGPGAVWLFGLMSLTEGGKDRVFAGYSRQQGLVPPDEQGVAEYDAAAGVFKSVGVIDKGETWRRPNGCSVQVKDAEGDYFYFSLPFAHTRVKATATDIATAASYETLRYDPAAARWHWQTAAPPTTQEEETKLLQNGQMPPEQAHYQLKAGGKLIRIHGASIAWNPWRQRFVLIGTQRGEKDDPSALGEIWYAESPHVTGPWIRATKIATHPRYTFYNPVQHPLFAEQEGRMIYFQGTYSLEFSGNPLAPARYDYNQLMYRLDLSTLP